MTSVLICRDGQEDSVVGNLALARSLAAHGDEVSVLFAGDALVAMHTGTFEWSPNFVARDARAVVIAGAERDGLPLADRARDQRWSDVRSLVGWAAQQPRLRILACPLWVRILGAETLPSCLEQISEDDLVVLLKSADTIVGGY
jgi:hypothetical protein